MVGIIDEEAAPCRVLTSGIILVFSFDPWTGKGRREEVPVRLPVTHDTPSTHTLAGN